MKSLVEKVDAIDLSDFKILEINKSDKITLIKATIHCPVYFAFYSNFIVCTGDFGEWIFDCTWQTNERSIPDNINYLFGKLSTHCKKEYFDSSEIVEGFQEAKDNFYETYDILDSCGDDVLETVNELFDDFGNAMRGTDKYRIVSVVDEYAEDICDELGIEFDTEIWNNFYEIGTTVHPQLIVNLAMLKKLSEDGVLN